METMDLIFDNHRGQQIGRVFRNYFTLALLLKQLIFSIFTISANQSTISAITDENSSIITKCTGAKSSEVELNWIQSLQLKLSLARLETEKPNVPK